MYLYIHTHSYFLYSHCKAFNCTSVVLGVISVQKPFVGQYLLHILIKLQQISHHKISKQVVKLFKHSQQFPKYIIDSPQTDQIVYTSIFATQTEYFPAERFIHIYFKEHFVSNISFQKLLSSSSFYTVSLSFQVVF